MQLAHGGQLLDAMPTQQVPTEEWQPCHIMPDVSAS